MNKKAQKKVASILLKSAKASGKKLARPVVQFLKKSVIKRSGPPSEKGGPWRKRRRKKSLGTYIQARTAFKKDKARPKDVLAGNDIKSYLKIRAWSPRANFLAKAGSKRYRPLPFDKAQKKINEPQLSRQIMKKAEKEIDRIVKKEVDREIKKAFKGLSKNINLEL